MILCKGWHPPGCHLRGGRRDRLLDFGFYNMDCMKGMKQFPDKYFDLAIVDPPYGGGSEADAEETFNGAIVGRFGGTFKKYFDQDKRGHMGGGHMKKYGYGHWDIAPSKEYFNELFRISKNQIIWGAIILNCHQQDASSYGGSCQYQKNFQWLWQNMRGLHSTIIQKCLNMLRRVGRETIGFTRHRNQWHCMSGF